MKAQEERSRVARDRRCLPEPRKKKTKVKEGKISARICLFWGLEFYKRIVSRCALGANILGLFALRGDCLYDM